MNYNDADYPWIHDDNYERVQDVITLIKRTCDVSKEEQKNEKDYAYFKKTYAYSVLKELNEEQLLLRIFEWKAGGLCYDCSRNYYDYGAAGTQGDNNKIMFEGGVWKRGKKTDQSTLKEEAREFCYGFMDVLGFIESKEAFESVQDYYDVLGYAKGLGEIYKKLENNWVQKALHMIYPSLFAEFYDAESWQRKLLCALQVRPHEKSFIRNGQISLISQALGYKNGYAFAHDIYHTYGWLNQSKVYRMEIKPDHKRTFYSYMDKGELGTTRNSEELRSIKDEIDRNTNIYGIVVATCEGRILGVAHDLEGDFITNSTASNSLKYSIKCTWKKCSITGEILKCGDEKIGELPKEILDNESLALVYHGFFDSYRDAPDAVVKDYYEVGDSACENEKTVEIFQRKYRGKNTEVLKDFIKADGPGDFLRSIADGMNSVDMLQAIYANDVGTMLQSENVNIHDIGVATTELLNAIDETERREIARKSPLTDSYKARLLSIMFPEQFLGIVDEENLDVIIEKLGIIIKEGDLWDKQAAVLRWKKFNKPFSEMSNEQFYEVLRKICGVNKSETNIKFLDENSQVISENEKADYSYEKDLMKEKIQQKSFEYNSKPREPEQIGKTEGGVTKYKRSKKRALNALAHAHYKCEYDNAHITFKRRNSDVDYTESHHLIPMAYSDQFKWTLDTEENIVSLCSNCHNRIHYGEDADIIIKKLFEERKNDLNNAGIEVSLSTLLKMYGYDM